MVWIPQRRESPQGQPFYVITDQRNYKHKRILHKNGVSTLTCHRVFELTVRVYDMFVLEIAVAMSSGRPP